MNNGNFLGIKRYADKNNNPSRKEKNEEIYKQKLRQKKNQRKKNKASKKEETKNSKEYYLQLINNQKTTSNTQKLLSINNDIQNDKDFKEISDLFEKNIQQQQLKIDSLTKEKNINQNNTKEKNSNDSDTESLTIPENTNNKLSKKKLLKLNRISLAELKKKATYPEVVEPWDVTAIDPELLIYFKCMPNTVPVPTHWGQSGKYLQSQRGKIRGQFSLPDFIEATGITRVRKIDQSSFPTIQQRARQRMQPKLGRLDIDYQILYDAFFKYQTKRELTKIGDVYYEGKEFDDKMKKYKPGKISAKLRSALGITNNAIPPFVQNMQRFGAPPAYPFLKIPGVNVADNDSTVIVTPNLWGEPEYHEVKESIWNFDTDKSHWYHYNKEDFVESDEGEQEKLEEDMGNDQDDLEISDEEKPDVNGLFNGKNNNVGLLDEVKEDKENKENKENIENKENKENGNDGENKFYKVIEKQDTELNNNELNPVGFKYNIKGETNKEENDNKEKNKKEEEYEDEEENEEDKENNNKNIFN